MRTSYDETEDILVIRFSDKPVVREVSENWHTHISHADDGSIVEIVVLDARANGAWPFEIRQAHAA